MNFVNYLNWLTSFDTNLIISRIPKRSILCLPCKNRDPSDSLQYDEIIWLFLQTSRNLPFFHQNPIFNDKTSQNILLIKRIAFMESFFIDSRNILLELHQNSEFCSVMKSFRHFDLLLWSESIGYFSFKNTVHAGTGLLFFLMLIRLWDANLSGFGAIIGACLVFVYIS